MQVYNAVTSSSSFWKRSLTFVGYDEHGGFFDHVSPPLITTNPPAGVAYDPFLSLGPRTPAYILSPFVNSNTCIHEVFDHTSVLKFIAAKFGNGSYSPEVDSRPVASLSKVLSFENPILNPPPAPALDEYLSRRPPSNPFITIPSAGTDLQQAFRVGTAEMRRQGGDSHPTLGKLLQQVPT